jgi:ketosteroid isomerase-like protein
MMHPPSPTIGSAGAALPLPVSAGTGATPDPIAYLRTRLRMHHAIEQNERAQTLVASVLGAIDRRDTVDFLAALTDDCEFRFASSPPVHGRDAIRGTLESLFAATHAIEHDCANVWSMDGHIVARGEATYRFNDGTVKRVPFCDVWRLDDEGAISRYEIYCDMNV